MEYRERQRLIGEYFDAVVEQQAIRQKLKVIRTQGDQRLVSVAEQQAEVVIEECYDAWRALNAHRCSPQCEGAE